MHEDPVNILLVDDQPGKLLAYEAILGELGETLVKANSAREALDVLLRTEVAVILIDVHMPELDGFELAALIREHPRYQRIALVFVSAVHMTDIDRLRGYQTGAIDYVSVPIVPEILRAKVAAFSDLYRKTRQLEALNRELEARVEERTAELRASEQALQAADRRKDEFLATLSHELRNPLAPILNAVQLLDLGCGEPSGSARGSDEQRARALAVIQRQVLHMTRLIDDLLDVSRITSGTITLQRTRLPLSQVISRALETAEPQLQQRGFAVHVHVHDDELIVDGDITRLVQVVANLLHNAAKFTAEGGRIDVETRRDGDHAVLLVRDTGIGIAQEMLPRVFDLFTQVSRDSQGTGGGLGVGLSIVRQLVQMHGGDVTAHSEGEGLGTTLTVRLPLLLGAQDTAAAATTPPQRSASRRILIADDNDDALQTLSWLLESFGHEVHTARDGLEAVSTAAAVRPEVVILDIGMPNLDGYGAAEQIRGQPWGRPMTLVAQTGWGQPSDKLRARQAGFDLHLTKPIDVDRLVAVLADAGGD